MTVSLLGCKGTFRNQDFGETLSPLRGEKSVKRFERKAKVANFVTDKLQFDGYR